MDEEERPTPEQLLAAIRNETEEREEPRPLSRRGRLKIFFGYASGVGKTYSMLQEAQQLKQNGIDVVIGYVEPHGRAETTTLLANLEQLPLKNIRHRGITLREFDLDTALARKPALILVDELAHTNTPGMRHTKRWQDIEELLRSGIDVYTTCNVQHIESLNDVIAEISGIVVRETVPDDVFSRADELSLVDLSPEKLLKRLREGKVYIPSQAQRALRNFFREENLTALRELALRRVTEKVHADVENVRTRHGSQAVWATGEKLLVCISSSPTSAKVIRAAKRLANSIQAELIAVHVKSVMGEELDDGKRALLSKHLRLAERLGAETVTLTGEDLVNEMLKFAREKNVTKIVIGKSPPSQHWFPFISTTDRLIHESGGIDIYVICSTTESTEEAPKRFKSHSSSWNESLKSTTAWVGTISILTFATLLDLLLAHFQVAEANLVMVYLLAVVCVALRYGEWPSVAASICSVLCFQLLFTLPYYTIIVNDVQYLVTLFIMLLVGLTITALTERLRRSNQRSERNMHQSDALYRLCRNLSATSGQGRLVAEIERTVSETFSAQTVVFLPRKNYLQPILDHSAEFAANISEVAVAQWVFDHEEVAGRGTDTLPSAEATYFPLSSPKGPVGVLAIQTDEPEKLLIPESRRLLETYAAQVALALERDRLTLEAQEAKIQSEAERLRTNLLSSVSEHLLAPLATITDSASRLLQAGEEFNQEQRRLLLTTIFSEASHLSRITKNFLRISQLSTGPLAIQPERVVLKEALKKVFLQLEELLAKRELRVKLSDESMAVMFDPQLFEQLIINLLENSYYHTPPSTPIDIIGWEVGDQTILEVADRGPGLTSGDERRIFEKFQRGKGQGSHSHGIGLGLTVCRAIMEAHGGKIFAVNRDGGGAIFRLEFHDLPDTQI